MNTMQVKQKYCKIQPDKVIVIGQMLESVLASLVLEAWSKVMQYAKITSKLDGHRNEYSDQAAKNLEKLICHQTYNAKTIQSTSLTHCLIMAVSHGY